MTNYQSHCDPQLAYSTTLHGFRSTGRYTYREIPDAFIHQVYTPIHLDTIRQNNPVPVKKFHGFQQSQGNNVQDPGLLTKILIK